MRILDYPLVGDTVLKGSALEQALKRIDVALARMEALANRPAGYSTQANETLRAQVADAMRDLDRLIKDLTA